MFCPDTNEIVFNLDATHTMAITVKHEAGVITLSNMLQIPGAVSNVSDRISLGIGKG